MKKFRGSGIGHELIKAVLADLPPEAFYIYLHAQVQAIPFYEKLGFTKIGNEFEEAGILHYKMIKNSI